LAATQGMLGVAAFLWLVVAVLRSFWRGRHVAGAVALLGGWISYQVTVQVNFSYLPAAASSWLFLAVAGATWTERQSRVWTPGLPGHVAKRAAITTGAFSLLLVFPALVAPFLADTAYLKAQGVWHASDADAARRDIAMARLLAPGESTYAAYAGDMALDLDGSGQPGPQAHLDDAREAYRTAARLGTFDPAVYRHLALADVRLGRRAEARAAAAEALSLGPFDSRNRSLLEQLR